MAEEKIFVDGLIVKRNESAPEWVIANLSSKNADFIAWLKKHDKNGWTNFSIKLSREGKYYADLDTFEPKKNGNATPKEAPAPPPIPVDDEGDGLPF